ncbi:hypothetical protein B0H12DRAFT_393048 [Mycena haematopus]|nr:hypothetical protein B0H12DRAFT_393048 [Mycena haematopus]
MMYCTGAPASMWARVIARGSLFGSREGAGANTFWSHPSRARRSSRPVLGVVGRRRRRPASRRVRPTLDPRLGGEGLVATGPSFGSPVARLAIRTGSLSAIRTGSLSAIRIGSLSATRTGQEAEASAARLWGAIHPTVPTSQRQRGRRRIYILPLRGNTGVGCSIHVYPLCAAVRRDLGLELSGWHASACLTENVKSMAGSPLRDQCRLCHRDLRL